MFRVRGPLGLSHSNPRARMTPEAKTIGRGRSMSDRQMGAATVGLRRLELAEKLLLAGVDNFHRLGVATLAGVVHFEDVFVVANHAEHLFHEFILLTAHRTIHSAFERDELAAIFRDPFADEHRGVGAVNPDALVFALQVIITDNAHTFEGLAHELALEFFLNETAIQDTS